MTTYIHPVEILTFLPNELTVGKIQKYLSTRTIIMQNNI
jgi:hypothetical protein